MIAGLSQRQRVLLSFSNLYSFNDSGFGFLQELLRSGLFEIEIVASNYGVSKALELKICSRLRAAGVDKVTIIHDYPDLGGSVVAKKFSRYWRLVVELLFWSRWYLESKNTHFDFVLQQTESSFSDLFASRVIARSALGQVFIWLTFPPRGDTLDPNLANLGSNHKGLSISWKLFMKLQSARVLDLFTYTWPRDWLISLLQFMVRVRSTERNQRVTLPPRLYMTNSHFTAEKIRARIPGSAVCLGNFSSNLTFAATRKYKTKLGVLLGSYITDGVLRRDQYLKLLDDAICFFRANYKISEVLLRAHPRYPGEAREIFEAVNHSRGNVTLEPNESGLTEFARNCKFVLGGYTAALLPVKDAIGGGATLIFKELFSADGLDVRDFSDFSVFRTDGNEGEILLSEDRTSTNSAGLVLLDWLSGLSGTISSP